MLRMEVAPWNLSYLKTRQLDSFRQKLSVAILTPQVLCCRTWASRLGLRGSLRLPENSYRFTWFDHDLRVFHIQYRGLLSRASYIERVYGMCFLSVSGIEFCFLHMTSSLLLNRAYWICELIVYRAYWVRKVSFVPWHELDKK